ncbi:hypothetical protein ACWD01_13075 [Streptomyces sp. NPDC002835]
MGSQDQHRRPDLFGAVSADQAAKQQLAADKAAPERQAREQQLAADAALHGTPAWDALSPARQQLVAAQALRTARTAGGNDAA